MSLSWNRLAIQDKTNFPIDCDRSNSLEETMIILKHVFPDIFYASINIQVYP